MWGSLWFQILCEFSFISIKSVHHQNGVFLACYQEMVPACNRKAEIFEVAKPPIIYWNTIQGWKSNLKHFGAPWGVPWAMGCYVPSPSLAEAHSGRFPVATDHSYDREHASSKARGVIRMWDHSLSCFHLASLVAMKGCWLVLKNRMHSGSDGLAATKPLGMFNQSRRGMAFWNCSCGWQSKVSQVNLDLRNFT